MSEGGVKVVSSASAEGIDRLRTACALAFLGAYFLPAVGLDPGEQRLLGYQAATVVVWVFEDSPLTAVCWSMPHFLAVGSAIPHFWTRWFCAVLAVGLLGLVVFMAVLIPPDALLGFWVWLGAMGGIALTALPTVFRPIAARARLWPFRFVAIDLMVVAGCFAACVFWADR